MKFKFAKLLIVKYGSVERPTLTQSLINLLKRVNTLSLSHIEQDKENVNL